MPYFRFLSYISRFIMPLRSLARKKLASFLADVRLIFLLRFEIWASGCDFARKADICFDAGR